MMSCVSGLALVNYLAVKGFEFNVFEAQPNCELNPTEWPRFCLHITLFNQEYNIRLDNSLECLNLFNRILLEFPER